MKFDVHTFSEEDFVKIAFVAAKDVDQDKIARLKDDVLEDL